MGMGTPDHTLPISDASAREINLISTWRYADAYPRAIEIATASLTKSTLKNVQLPSIGKLVTHRFRGLNSIQDAFDHAEKTRDDEDRLIVKVALELSETS